ncbi:sensor histidine kinase [Phytoactinopolyspora limicola]|uniref:sensor histidine kinase n=1 Tax=Phytoactinopolyspora limicola TaxID=2715536 RepID=UPI001409FCF4|nr:sensor histidine kinase [Phytoactinopolyspora limicola]
MDDATHRVPLARLWRRGRSAGPKVLAWCGAVAYPLLLIVAVLTWPPGSGGVDLLLPAVLTALPIGLLWLNPLPALALMLIGSFTVIVSEPAWQLGTLLALAQHLAVGLIAATRSRWISVGSAVVVLSVQLAAATYYTSGSDDYTSTAVFLTLATVVAWLAGRAIRDRHERSQLLRAHATTEAVQAERIQIARELHDMVAHSIGVIAIQAGMGRRVIDTQPGEARAALAVIESTSRDTLAGLRRLVGALRQADADSGGAPLGPAPTLADLDPLVATTMDAGVRVHVEWRGRRRPLPADIEMSAFRIVQEAITNVVRHAGVHECHVVIDCQEDELSIEIVDDGAGGPVAETGYGIAGMRERAGLLSGRFDAGPQPAGGFRVAVSLPVPPEAP